MRTTLGRIDSDGRLEVRSFHDDTVDQANRRLADARPYGWVVVLEVAADPADPVPEPPDGITAYHPDASQPGDRPPERACT